MLEGREEHFALDILIDSFSSSSVSLKHVSATKF